MTPDTHVSQRSFLETTGILGVTSRGLVRQAEAQFALRDITAHATKYYYVIAALNSSTAARVVGLFGEPSR